MMRLFFGWLLGVERDGRPVVNDERGSNWGAIALHCGKRRAGEQLGTMALH